MGTRSLSSIRVSAQLEALLTNLINASPALSSQVAQGGTITPATSLANGTSADQADRIIHDPARSLTGASSETIDLHDFAGFDIGAGAALDALGQAAGFAEIVAILIENSIDSLGNLTIGGEGSTAAWQGPFNASDTNAIGPIPPGGILMLFNRADPAWTVTDVTSHLLKIASSNDATYSLTIIGRSA